MADNNIPTASPAPDVEPRPMPTPFNENRVTPEMYGEGAAQVDAHEAAKQSQLSSEYLQRSNAVAADGAFGQAQAALNNIILDPKNGFAGLRGGDAIAKSDEYQKKFTDAVDNIKKGLNGAQLREVGFRIDRLRESGIQEALTHERREHDTVADATFKGTEQVTIDNISQLAGSKADPALIDKKMFDLLGSARARATWKYGANPPADAVKAEALPLLQKASLEAMTEAIATNDPEYVTSVLAVVGEHLGPHASHFARVANAMQKQHSIVFGGETILGAATKYPLLPDGKTTIARIDEGELAKGLASIKPDAPFAADKLKYVETTAKRLDDVWKKTVAQVVDQAKREGDPAATGAFDIDKVSPARRQWLHDNDENSLIALRGLQNREDALVTRQQKLEGELESRDTYGEIQTQIVAKENRDLLLKTSPEEFQSALLKGVDLTGVALSGKLTQKDLSRAVTLYRQAQKDAGANSLDEKPEATVAARIQLAAGFDPVTMTTMTRSYAKALAEKAHGYIAANKGTITQEKLVEYIDRELAEGKIQGTGFFSDDTKRLIGAQSDLAYRGKTFKASEGGYSEVLGAPPAPVAAAAPANPSQASSAKPDPISQARKMLKPGETLVKDPKGGLHALDAGEKMPDGWSEVK